ncbi:DUF11 domain-containing protein [Psychrobacter pygoscelis]|uniref:DUF11 domain-containing protein n=1 Tax=Psychrobacter pygoscelis TaxID=2488563 RepID=UPI0010405B84|nr:DUF11 domain-containing protein [Psychrobacter pygoscelis]
MKINAQLTTLASALAIGLVGITPATAEAPASGTQITNFASATYEVGGQTITTQSNTVQITVGDAPSFEITQNQEQTINKNTGEVTFTHTIKNTGNTNDTYTIEATNDTGDQLEYEEFTIYPEDSANPGQPDKSNPISNNQITVEAGSSKKFFVVAKDNDTSSFKDGNTGKVTVTATNETSISKTNKDTGVVKVSNLVIAKSATISLDNASRGSAENNDEITYTIKFGNSSASTPANDVIIVDTLPNGVEYIVDSAQIDGSPVNSSNFTVTGQKIVYKAGTVAVNTNAADNAAGTLTFKVRVVDESQDIQNVASVGTDSDGDGNIDENTPPTSTINTPNGQTNISGSINESETDDYADNETVPGNASKDNQIIKEVIITNATSNSATSGTGNGQLNEQVVTFETYVHNTGNVAKDFNLSIDDSATQAGQLTDITFSNTTGVIQPGEKKKVTVTAKVPAGTILQDGHNYPVTIKASPEGSSSSDNIKLVVKAQKALELIKKQALVTPGAGKTCSSVASQAEGKYSDIALTEARPGDCIFYQITATNFYPSEITNVVISDTLESSVLDNSTMAIDPSATKGTASFETPRVLTTAFTLANNEKAVLTFARQINAN